jgi:hypothetical protein
MPILNKTVEVLTATTPLTVGKIRLGAKYGELLRIYARNFASSAKAAAGTDTAQRIKLTDGNANVVYLDAADRDYATAQVILAPSIDDTATGLGVTAVDATGAAATAGAGAPIIMQDPVTVTVVNAGTATDYLQVKLVWRV